MRTAPPVPAGVGFPLGVALGTAATALAVAAGAKGTPVISLVAMVAVTGTVAALTTWRAALATGAVSWALHSGFVLGEHAQLTFTAQSGQAAVVLGVCVLIVSGFAHLARTLREHVPQARFQVPGSHANGPRPRPSGRSACSARRGLYRPLRDGATVLREPSDPLP